MLIPMEALILAYFLANCILLLNQFIYAHREECNYFPNCTLGSNCTLLLRMCEILNCFNGEEVYVGKLATVQGFRLYGLDGSVLVSQARGHEFDSCYDTFFFLHFFFPNFFSPPIFFLSFFLSATLFFLQLVFNHMASRVNLGIIA